MNPIWPLVRVSIKANSFLSLVRLKWKMNRKEGVFLLLGVGIAVLVSIPIYLGVFSLSRNFYQVLQPLGQGGLLLLMFILVSQMLVLVFGIYYTLSVFYFSRDVHWLLALPVTPTQLILAKTATILANEYLSLIPLLPFLVHFGVISGAGIGYWIRLPLIFFLLPIIPLIFASLLNILLMRLVNIGRRKDLLIVIGSLILIGIALVPQVLLQRSGGMESAQVMAQFSQRDGLVQVMGRKFPPAVWATRALIDGFSSGAGSLALFVGFSTLFLLLLWQIGKKLYFRSLIGMSEVAQAKPGHLAIKKHRKFFLTPLGAIFQREWRLMNRTPIFLLNGILSTLLFPLMFTLIFSLNRQQDKLISQIMAVQKPELKALVAAAILLFCGSMNGTAASAFSREGSCFWISKVIPVPYRIQIGAKLLHALVISLVGIVTGSVFVMVFLKLSLGLLAVAWILAALGVVTFATAGLCIDLFHPLLDWISPQKAIKQNINVFLSMAIDIGTIFALGYLAFKLVAWGWKPAALYFTLAGILAVVGTLFLFLLRSFAYRNYSRVER